MRTKTLDDNTEASHPGNVRLSHAKLKMLQPELFSITKWLGFLARNPSAMFLSVGRSYWKTHIEEHLMYGDSRAALVVCTAPLLIAGSEAGRLYGNLSPFIAEFLTDELAAIEQRKTEIQEAEWLRTEKLSSEYLLRPDAQSRDGRPLLSSFPANLRVTTDT